MPQGFAPCPWQALLFRQDPGILLLRPPLQARTCLLEKGGGLCPMPLVRRFVQIKSGRPVSDGRLDFGAEALALREACAQTGP